jgi:hypothetical protein
VVALARSVLDLHDAGHGTVEVDYETAYSVHLRPTSRDVGGIPEVGHHAESLRLVLSFWDRRDQAACEWTDRLLPVPVVPGTDFDVVELPTLQRGQDLVDVGCDPAVMEAVAAVPSGGAHVIAAETLEGDLLGYAAALRETDDGLVVDRVFAPKAANPRTVAAMRERFEAFVAANVEAAVENDALMGMTP